MSRLWGFLLMLFCTPAVLANLLSATWGTEPSAPIYVGQQYDLTLTLETLTNEEVTNVRLTQGPGRPPEEQHFYEKDNRRYTILSWRQCEPRKKIVAIPAGRLVADITHVQTFGFMRSANTTRQAVQVSAFNYDVAELPGEAWGVPIGTFELTLKADSQTFEPGEVRLLTVEIMAHEGRIPETFQVNLEPTAAGVCYPFRWVSQTERKWVAQAHFVVSEERDVTLRLKTFKAFDLATRSLVDVSSAPLLLRLSQAERSVIEDTTLSLESTVIDHKGKQLRFAPSSSAPVIGVLETNGFPLSTYQEWVYIQTDSLSGWIRKDDLEDSSR